MSYNTSIKLEGGHKSGRSNMCHWDDVRTIKEDTKKIRRRQEKQNMNQYLGNVRDWEEYIE